MKQLLQTEQLAQLALAITGLYLLPVHIAWWAWILLFFAPDISMIGYLVNTRIGAWSYNLGHHKLLAGILIIAGFFLHENYVLLAGLLLWAHSSFDRLLGYGLKYEDSFQHTHLGMIGKGKA